MGRTHCDGDDLYRGQSRVISIYDSQLIQDSDLSIWQVSKLIARGQASSTHILVVN